MCALQLLLCTSAPAVQKLEIKNKDVDQVFCPAKSRLRINVYVRPNSVLSYPKNFLFKAIHPTYGLPESPLHWFSTYSSHHKEKLRMRPSVYDLCFIYTEKCLARSKRSEDAPRGMVCLLADGTSYACNKKFSKLEKTMSAAFDTKPANISKESSNLTFHGAVISRNTRTHSLIKPNDIN